MKLALLTALALCFLAANSLLTRAGVVDGTDPLAFATVGWRYRASMTACENLFRRWMSAMRSASAAIQPTGGHLFRAGSGHSLR